jgi:hypothetical protein
MSAILDVVAVGAVDDRDRWQRDAPANRQCDALPARSRALRGRAKPLVEVTTELDRADDRVQGDALDTGSARRPNDAISHRHVQAQPHTLTVHPARPASWRLTWTHPADWKRLDRVVLRLESRGKSVGRVRLDQETRRLRASGPAVRLVKRRNARRCQWQARHRQAQAADRPPLRRPHPGRPGRRKRR